MNYLSVENISRSYGERVLFDGASFGLQKGQKSALVARNGTGKTSILRIIAGIEEPETGSVTFRKDIRVGYLDQEPVFPEGATISEVLHEADNEQARALRDYQQCIDNGDEGEALQEALDRVDRLGAWDYEARSQEILNKLKVGERGQTVEQLSGGQRKRLSLAKLLIADPDLMVLDEPTNHLDIAMVEWLEDYLSQDRHTIFMVTHDRYFLDNICDEILELDAKQVYRYKGNYSYFLEKRDERKENQAREVGKAKNLMVKELDWIRRMPKARGTKPRARIEAFEELREKASRNLREKELQLDINMTRLGGKILELHHLRKAYGDLVISDDFSYKFKVRDRVGMVGPNGVGKTTLLNMFLGIEPPDGGKVITGETVVFGYYNQEGLEFKPGKRVIEVVKEIAEVIPLAKGKKLTASQLLERFLFPTSMHYNLVSKLSGGEKRRLYLLTILISNPNFLILDEPTNDLDILTLNVLEDFLEDYPGCLLIVTHDRYFMDKLVDHLFVLEGNGKIRDFPGHYSHYRDWKLVREQKARQVEKPAKAATPKAEKPKAEKTKLTYKEKLEFERLEEEIEALETRKEELNQALSAGSTDHEELQKMTEELGQVVTDLETKSDRWLELSEYV